MIVVRLIGGLGNQMFQYAAGLAVAKRLGVELVLDSRGFADYTLHTYGLDALQVSARQLTSAEAARFPEWRRQIARGVHRFTGWQGQYYFEPFFTYNPRWQDLPDHSYLNGYFQSEKYFAEIREQLRAEFAPRAALTATNQSYISQAGDSCSVSIHVRRGDYVTDPRNNNVLGVCSIDYYRRAIDWCRSHLTNPRFFVFSNDMAWSKDNLPLGQDAAFIEGNGKSPEMDMLIMSRCQHHIIANSSFSWWGAWLASTLEHHVIAPTPWFETSTLSAADLLPASWLQLGK